MTLEERFEQKRQELARVEQKEAFLRQQLEECVAARLKLVGALEQLQELYREQEQQQVTPDTPPAEPLRVPRGKPRREELVNGRDHP